MFYPKPPVYNPQFTYGEPYRKTHARSGSSPNYGKFERVATESNDGRRYPSIVPFVPTVSGGIHPTQKPVELCEYFIKTYTKVGAVVADICAGSGTTAVAALNTGRRFSYFENAPVFYGPAVNASSRCGWPWLRAGKESDLLPEVGKMFAANSHELEQSLGVMGEKEIGNVDNTKLYVPFKNRGSFDRRGILAYAGKAFKYIFTACLSQHH